MTLRRLGPDDAAPYRALMLQAYADEPEAFTSTVVEREPLPLEWWRARMPEDPEPPQVTLGAFEGGDLVW